MHNNRSVPMIVMNVEDAAELLRMEYAETPRMALTFCQAQRLCDLSTELCDRALRKLLESGFLKRTVDGQYVRDASSRVVAAVARLQRETSSAGQPCRYLRENASIARFLSGPPGGDLQVGAGIVDGRIDFVVVFWDPAAASRRRRKGASQSGWQRQPRSLWAPSSV